MLTNTGKIGLTEMLMHSVLFLVFLIFGTQRK